MPKKTNKRKGKLQLFLLTAVIVSLLLIVGVLSYVPSMYKSTDSQKAQTASQIGEKASYDAYANIASEDIQQQGGILELMWNSNNPYYGYDTNPIAALVHIDTIDGGRNYSPISEQYTMIQTYGKMTVLDTYKGNITPGEQLNYARLGGIVTYDEYWKGLNKQQQDKILHLNNGKKPMAKKYVKDRPMDDIDIEVDKKYLVFLEPQTSKDGKHHEYSVIGLQYGLREARGAGDDITVLDNDTNQWESLSRVVRLDS